MSWISLSFRWSLVLLFALAAMSSTFAKQANAKTLAKKTHRLLKARNIVTIILLKTYKKLSNSYHTQVENDIKILKGKKTSGKT